LKKDPRDGKYKLLEINARTTTENRLTAACGADIEYISYVDASGMSTENSLPPPSDIFWIDDIVDLFSCFMLLKRREIGLGEVIKVLKTPKVHSVAACDDPSPFAIYILDVILQTLSARAAFFRTFYERITHSLTMSRRALRA
jgi:predicted ATP-grasp superfamily ATP-dependent carboligase